MLLRWYCLAPFVAHFCEATIQLQTVFHADSVYHAVGQLPCVISAPHGGLYKPAFIPDRQWNDSALVADAYTMDIALGVAARLESHYQLDPHVVACEISRQKVDVNRPIDLGAESEAARAAWTEYHDKLKSAVQSVITRHKYGLLIDLHGHTHEQGMVELGYLIEKANLAELSNEELNEVILTQSSIQTLAQRVRWLEPVDMLRKHQSFGAVLQDSHVQVVPSPEHPYPLPDERYFRGGYTTRTYHGNATQSGMDCIQIEMPRQLRFTEQGREKLISSITNAVIYMLDNYYLERARL